MNALGGVGPNLSKINDNGDIAGGSLFLPAGSTTPVVINYPGSYSTQINGLNNKNQLVGRVELPNVTAGFTFLNGSFSQINVGTVDTSVYDINNNGDIAGAYESANTPPTGFLLFHGSLTTFNVPNSTSATFVTGLNDMGEAVGYYANGYFLSGFIRSPDGVISTFGFSPTNPSIVPADINNNGVIVGSYAIVATNTSGGFVRYGEMNYSFEAPGAIETYFTGINNANTIIGTAVYSNGNTTSFTVNVSTIPEPASLFVVSIGLFCLAAVKHYRSRRNAHISGS